MRLLSRLARRSRRQRGAAILEYVILAIGIAIFCTFGVLKFGKAAQHQLNEATQVLGGVQNADVFNRATDAASTSASDNARTGVNLGRD